MRRLGYFRVLRYFGWLLLCLGLIMGARHALASEPVTESAPSPETEAALAQRLDTLNEPLYNPFVERYLLDELKQLRVDMANQRVELLQQVVDRHVESIDKGVSYATNTITYFFYLIAGVTSILVLVGWSSIREMKERVGTLADEEVRKLVEVYEARLQGIEKQLTQKSRHIDANREEIERTQELHSLWLRAAQESMPANKMAVYDQILGLKPNDCEALTYKADAVLELGEPQWAINLCQQALALDSDNAHAFYQLACAHTALSHFEEALHYLQETLVRADSYRDHIAQDLALKPLAQLPAFQKLLGAPLGGISP